MRAIRRIREAVLGERIKLPLSSCATTLILPQLLLAKEIDVWKLNACISCIVFSLVLIRGPSLCCFPSLSLPIQAAVGPIVGKEGITAAGNFQQENF